MPSYHISPKTKEPAICKATSRNCPYDGEHFDSEFEAWKSQEPKKLNDFSFIKLSSNLGSAEVRNGDLSNPTARVLLSTGLCGDLALAIHQKTGATPYFLSFSFSDPEKLSHEFEQDPDNIFRGTSHVLVESPSKSGFCLDAHGQFSKEEIEENWDGAFLVKGTAEMLRRYADEKSAERLGKFADAAIELDRRGESYEFEEEVFSDYDEDEDWEDED